MSSSLDDGLFVDAAGTFEVTAQQMPRDTVRVCDRDYVCRGEDVPFWSALDAERHTTTAPSSACHLDLLAHAAHHVKGCRIDDLPGLSSTQRARLLEPYTTFTDGTHVAQVSKETSTGLPNIVDATWRAVDPVTDATHELDRVQHLGADTASRLSLLVLKERASLPPDSGQAFLETNSLPPPASAKPSVDAWHRCQASAQRTPRACATDDQCPLTKDQEWNLLWTTARDLGVDLTKGLEGFVDSMKRKVRDDLEWTPERVSGLDAPRMSEARLKSSLRILLDTDPTFQASAHLMITQDSDFADARRKASAGACAAYGRCVAGDRVATTSRLHDGSADVSLSLDGDRVLYTRRGVTREARAERCDAANEELRRACDVAPVVDTPLLDASVPTVASAYRVYFPDEGRDYLVTNGVEVRDPTDCARRLCEHNRDACPSTLCARTADGDCRPK